MVAGTAVVAVWLVKSGFLNVCWGIANTVYRRIRCGCERKRIKGDFSGLGLSIAWSMECYSTDLGILLGRTGFGEVIKSLGPPKFECHPREEGKVWDGVTNVRVSR